MGGASCVTDLRRYRRSAPPSRLLGSEYLLGGTRSLHSIHEVIGSTPGGRRLIGAGTDRELIYLAEVAFQRMDWVQLAMGWNGHRRRRPGFRKWDCLDGCDPLIFAPVLLPPALRARSYAGLLFAALASPMAHAQQAEPDYASAAASMNAGVETGGGVADAAPAGFGAETVRFTQQVASYALQMVGTVYRYGGAEPATGFDCSGLVQYVYRQVSGVTLPRTARSLSGLGSRIPMVGLLPGDLVFFNTRRFAYSHVGIYIGHNQFIHAPRTGERVEVSTIDSRYWQRRFNGARRLVGSVPGLLPALVDQARAAAGAAFLSDPAESADSVGY